MVDKKIYTLEDDFDYVLVDTLVEKNIKYILLVQDNNNRNICIRKIDIEDGNECLNKLNNLEFDDILNKFVTKSKNLFD